MTASSERPVDIGWVSAVVRQLVEAGPPVMVHDAMADRLVPVSAEMVASPEGFLPLLLSCGDTVWREASGRSLGLDLTRDADAVLGYRVNGAAPGSVAPMLLSVMHVMGEVARPDMLLLNDLHEPWRAAQERLLVAARPSPTASPTTAAAASIGPRP